MNPCQHDPEYQQSCILVLLLTNPCAEGNSLAVSFPAIQQQALDVLVPLMTMWI